MNAELLKLLLVLTTLAVSHAKPTIDMSARLRYCGTRLSTVLGVLCTNFNQPAWDTDDDEQGNRVIRSTQEEGVVDECCRTSCSWNHLASYCSKGTVNEETILNHPLLRELFEAQSTHIMSGRSAEAINDSDSESEMQYGAAERSAPVLGTVSPARTRARLVPAPWSPAVDALFFDYQRN